MTVKKPNKIKEFFNVSEIWNYVIGKNKSMGSKDINIKMMHWMNMLAIIVFLVALIVWIIKRI